jgi:hypothetical protein
MVLVPDSVPRKDGYVKVMTVRAQKLAGPYANSLQITSTLKNDGDYVPISPT